MRDEKLRVSLNSKLDSNNKKYYVGKIKFPGTLNASKGIVFLVFTSSEGEEEIQIAEMEDIPPKRRIAGRFPGSDEGPSSGRYDDGDDR